MKEKDKNGCNILIMTLPISKRCIFQKVLKTTTSTPPPLSPAKSKRQKSHLATAVICN